MATIQARILQKNNNIQGWNTTNHELMKGEIGLETDTFRFKHGTGSQGWTALSYSGESAFDLAYDNTIVNRLVSTTAQEAIDELAGIYILPNIAPDNSLLTMPDDYLQVNLIDYLRVT